MPTAGAFQGRREVAGWSGCCGPPLPLSKPRSQPASCTPSLRLQPVIRAPGGLGMASTAEEAGAGQKRGPEEEGEQAPQLPPRPAAGGVLLLLLGKQAAQ